MKENSSVASQLIDRAGICTFQWVVGNTCLHLGDSLLTLCGLSKKACRCVSVRQLMKKIDRRDRHELIHSLIELHAERRFGKFSVRLCLNNGETSRFDLHTAFERGSADYAGTLYGVVVDTTSAFDSDATTSRLAPVRTYSPAPTDYFTKSRTQGREPGWTHPINAMCQVLVVDDNPDVADALSKMLRRRRWQVNTAYSGRHALQLARVINPDIVFLDIAMPDISGVDVARSLRHQQRHKSLTLIAVTGVVSTGGRQATYQAVFDCHLTKPATSAEIFGALRSLDH